MEHFCGCFVCHHAYIHSLTHSSCSMTCTLILYNTAMLLLYLFTSLPLSPHSVFLPDPNNITSQQTSPITSAYPTWSKEFIYAGVDSLDLAQGGLEVLLYDHHVFFSDNLVGGVRLSVPQKRPTDRLSAPKALSNSVGYLVSPPNSRSSSPILPARRDLKSYSSQEGISTPTLLVNAGHVGKRNEGMSE